MAATPQPSDPAVDPSAEDGLVSLADLRAAAGVAPIPPDQSTGVIYGSDEAYLAHLNSQPYEPAGA